MQQAAAEIKNGNSFTEVVARVKNHSDELIFHSQGLRRSAANLEIASENSPSRNSPRVSSRKALRHEGKSEKKLAQRGSHF